VLVEVDLTLHGVRIAGKCGVFDDDFVAIARWAIERNHEQVQVGRERIHRDDFFGHAPHYARQGFADFFVIWQPRMLGGEVAFDSERGPIGEFLLECGACGFGLQAQRVADEVERLACGRMRKVKEIAEGAK
jgi:hypothetical protein